MPGQEGVQLKDEEAEVDRDLTEPTLSAPTALHLSSPMEETGQ